MPKAYLVTVELTLMDQGAFTFSSTKLALDCETPEEAIEEVLNSHNHGAADLAGRSEFTSGGLHLRATSVEEVKGNDKMILSRYL
jgi:hypothetical protein